MNIPLPEILGMLLIINNELLVKGILVTIKLGRLVVVKQGNMFAV
jgi:hypothetical protein